MKKSSQESTAKGFTMSFSDFKIIMMSFVLNERFKQGKNIEHDIETETGYSYDHAKKELKVLLRVSISGEKSPYLVEVKTIGFFHFKENIDSEPLKTLSMINCPAILFPYVRETIADITRRAGFPSLHLQPFNFAKIYTESKAKKDEEEKQKVSGQ